MKGRGKEKGKEIDRGISDLLMNGVSPLQKRLNRDFYSELARGYVSWERETTPEPEHPALRLTEYLYFVIRRRLEMIAGIQADYHQFNSAYSRSSTGQERRRLILNYAEKLGASSRQLKEDRKALNRWLGPDAMSERRLVAVANLETQICTCLERLCMLMNLVPPGSWQRLDPQSMVETLMNYEGHDQVLEWVLEFLARFLEAAPLEERQEEINETIVQKIYRCAMDPGHSTAIQGQALQLLAVGDIDAFIKVLRVKLDERHHPDAIFIRRYCVRIIGDYMIKRPEMEPMLLLASDDPSPFVRQQLAYSVCHTSPPVFKRYSHSLALSDPAPKVRAMMLLALGELIRRSAIPGQNNHRHQPENAAYGRDLLIEAIRTDRDEFVLKTAIKVIIDTAVSMMGHSPAIAHAWINNAYPVLKDLNRECSSLAVRGAAAAAGEQLWLLQSPQAQRLMESLRPHLENLKPGRSKQIPSGLLEDYDNDTIGRVLSLLAAADFGYWLSRGRRRSELHRGAEFRFRWWRFFYELFHPSPDKRQAYSHTRGRYFHGHLHAPSAILAELTETRVPGEPLVIDSEQGWRPYLPLPDQLLSMLTLFHRAPAHEIYSAEGKTTVTVPKNPLKRMMARLRLSLKFSRYAALRNWQEDHRQPPNSYVKAMEQLGFVFDFSAHPEKNQSGGFESPGVKRFFSVMALPTLAELWEKLKDYFVSIYENSFLELMIFTGMAVSLFIGRHLYLNWRHRKFRREIPLVIGGWGTRGKSGTERLKAALFNAMGLGVVSKTTGSEATFLHSWPMGPLHELPLFRPYEKATIWEQQDMTRIARQLEADVLLWECMALQPDYVKVLQRDWMNDDFSTITNSYPDHEDIMGPAGIDIPYVMNNFIPKNAVLFTSEEQMLPILQEGAGKQGSRLRSVGWLEAGLLTQDVLNRFPYSEHPYNIALVLALAGELGVHRDVALKEMADRAVPEIGMLKTFPPAQKDTRTIQFTNGMAANERVGFLSNWQRIGFDRHKIHDEPGVFISTVVNNRADRIPRSQVFANILVRDVAADFHFLIGGNLTGLTGYIRDEWEEYAATLSLDGLDRMAERLRLPTSPDLIRARLGIMLDAIGVTPGQSQSLLKLWDQPGHLHDSLSTHDVPSHLIERSIEYLRDMLTVYNQYREFKTKPRSEQSFRELLWAWFQKKLIVIHDYYAPGDAIVQRIVEETPPGFMNRVMGIQNIKGTGFDLVAKWQSWEQCHKILELVKSSDPREMERGMEQWASFSDYGLLSEDTVRVFIPEFKSSASAQDERTQARLMLVENQFQRTLEQVKERLRQETGQKGVFTRILDWLEGFLDAGDAVKRKKKAEKIYTDLVNQRISHPRAIKELNALNKRQKGGWLNTQIRATLDYFRR